MPSFSSAIGKKLGQLGVGSVIGGGLDAYFVYDTYHEARNSGNGVLMSAAKAAGEQGLMSIVGPGKYALFQLAGAVPGLAVKGYEAFAREGRSMVNFSSNKPFQTAQFNDSQQAYTMRQAGMKLAQASKYNIQQAMLGNEASYLHY